MKLGTVTKLLPSWKNALLAVLAAVLLILAFPDFDIWFLAWFALVPLLFAVEREVERGHSCPHEPEGRTSVDGSSTFFRTLSRSCGQECPRSFILGWIFGVIFFFGTCWWLTYAPITYAAFPPALAYFLLFCVTSVAAIFPGLFAAILSVLLRRFGTWAILLAPIVWVFTEFLRYWLTGSNWNAIGYSQAFGYQARLLAQVGGVYLTGILVILPSPLIAFVIAGWQRYLHDPETAPYFVLFVYYVFGWLSLADPKVREEAFKSPEKDMRLIVVGGFFGILILIVGWALVYIPRPYLANERVEASVVAIQPNVPMAGLSQGKWETLRQRHVQLAEQALATLPTENRLPTTVVFPESPMNFAWNDDLEFQIFIRGFARRNNVSVLFNSAEPDPANGKFYNSAVMIDPQGREVQQYDKIYLLPFGEAVPFPLDGIMPGFVGSFSYGQEYDLFPLGDAKAGVMICFESHFGQLSREFVRNGADVIIEMTNDGYLGPTPVLRQHLANAVFRAVETNRPVLRVTNVGITAYINERGEVLDAVEPYTEATRIWSVAKSDGSQTFYVRYGDWFAWLCSVVTIAMLVLGGLRRKPER